ncbi:MAG: HAD hydrolase family protein, partial [Gemmatimonadetes bacterium]|nr:HAD hydrolase family protein [Gemmatimonadota bacterium]
VPALAGIMERLGIGWEAVAFLGDDLPDLPAMRRVGLPAAVRNAVPEIVEVALWKGTRAGGHGAAREFSEAILRGRGVWKDLVERYCQERGVRG